LYYEYLPTGVSVGVNSTQEFYSASLFKLPVVMAYFKHKEKNNIQEDIKVKLTNSMIDPRFGNLWIRGAGYEIGLDEAAKLALTDSDNTAVNALGPYITSSDFDDVYNAIDIDLNLTSNGVISTAKSYSSILKSLFFSALLTKDDSERILSFLTESKFNDKLVAGIPSGVTVAHKIGVYEVGNDKSYSDCGIVYVPNRPYMLCMISKSDEQTARERMKEISSVVYDYVSSVDKPK
jgi:beta-lactamase class A